ncbi:hypothetical protein HY570_03500 [Candidatus Micrarchaeota archaeon]|nr:hypothetical protein [Candidatus Micrarchaeota archaeon]
MNIEKIQNISFALGFSSLSVMHAFNTIDSVWYVAVLFNAVVALIFLSKFYFKTEGDASQEIEKSISKKNT